MKRAVYSTILNNSWKSRLINPMLRVALCYIKYKDVTRIKQLLNDNTITIACLLYYYYMVLK